MEGTLLPPPSRIPSLGYTNTSTFSSFSEITLHLETFIYASLTLFIPALDAEKLIAASSQCSHIICQSDVVRLVLNQGRSELLVVLALGSDTLLRCPRKRRPSLSTTCRGVVFSRHENPMWTDFGLKFGNIGTNQLERFTSHKVQHKGRFE